MNRRELIASGAALGALLCAPMANASQLTSQRAEAATFPAVRRAPAELHAVVWDSRFPASRAFASEADDHLAPIRETNGDLTDLWFRNLDRAWAERAAPVVGCTSPQGLFCLEQLARDRSMRVVFRVSHEPLPRSRVRHTMTGDRATLIRAYALLRDGANWAAAMARVVVQDAPWKSAGAERWTAETKRGNAALGDPLVTWVIAHPLPVHP